MYVPAVRKFGALHAEDSTAGRSGTELIDPSDTSDLLMLGTAPPWGQQRPEGNCHVGRHSPLGYLFLRGCLLPGF